MATLRAAFRQAAAGRMGAVLIAGEAGVGKSRLVAEFAAELPESEAFVLVGQGVALGEHEIPYAPVMGALRSLPTLLSPDALDEVAGPMGRELAGLVPGVGEASWASGSGATDAFGRARLFELLLGLLGRLGARRSAVVVVEDLHWADGSTRDLLRFVVRSASTERLLLVLTYRSDDLHREHPARPYLAELGRDPRVARVELRPFSREELADHVLALRGALPSAAVLDELFERSEGNAFFAEELLDAIESEGAGRLPASLRDAMLVRVERLPRRTQEVLRVVAAAGRRVDYRLLAAALGSEDGLPAALRAAVDAHVLVPHADAYGFRHALLREAVYAEVLPGEREALHARLAAELQARPELAGGGSALHAELAHHWDAAGMPERALTASVRAGSEAERVYAHPEALRHFQRALELAEHLGPQNTVEIDTVNVTDRAARAARAVGDYELAIALGRRAIELAERSASRARVGLLHSRLAWVLDGAGREYEAREMSARALALMGRERTPERAQVLEAHARMLMLAARTEEARAPIEEAIAIARELDRPAILASALATQIIGIHGQPEAALAAGNAALAAARAAGEPETLLRAHINAAEALDQTGRVDAAIALSLEGVEVARQLGAERGLGALLKGDAARRLVKLGRFDDAASLAQAALRLAPVGSAAAVLHQIVATLAAHRGDVQAAEQAIGLARASVSGPGAGMWVADAAAAAAELELWRDDPARAGEVVEQALGSIEGSEFYEFTAPVYALAAWAHVDLALRARALRRSDEAEAARNAARATAARFDALLVAGAPPETKAYRTQLDAELGRLDDPPDAGCWESTRHRWEQLGYRFHAAVCGWREAEALLAGGGDRTLAASLLTAAAREARSLGAQPLLEQVEGLARRSRIAVGAAGDGVPEAPPAGLSPRELEVLGLMVEGHTNREIGAALFISEKTVRVHVSRVLAKLGAANRAQAATIAHRLGIAAPLE